MSLGILAILALVEFVAGFFDAIAGGEGPLAVPAFALAGLDPVAVVATNKLSSTFGSGSSSTLAFARAGKIDLERMWPSALGAVGGLAVYAIGGHIAVAAGLSMGVGQFLGSRLGAKAVLGAGVRLAPPMIVAISCLPAPRLATAPTYPLRDWPNNLAKPLFGG